MPTRSATTTTLVLAAATLGSHGFSPRPLPIIRASTKAAVHQGFDPFGFSSSEGPAAFSSSSSSSSSSIDESGAFEPPLPLAAGVAALAMLPDNAFAKGGEYGIFEGRISSLAPPAIMGVCFFVSLGAAYTGFQWRRIRDIMTEIGDMKTELAPKKGMMDRYKAMEEPSAADTAALAKVEAEVAEMNKAIDEKTNLRKDLLALDFRNRHWALGSVLLGLGISFAIEGPVNTYMRAGKLFPGPHLYAGAGCVAMWALAAALVPQMQKGQDWARSGHIALNTLSTGLFAWQISTGLGITAKVIANTKFP